MTPSNPTNGQPLIYRIMDARGVTHLVACINHTHSQDEVEGLPAALNNKAEKNHSHDSIGGDTDESAAEVTASEGTVHIEVRKVSEGRGECEITPSNIGNLARALDTPDTTPTANSDKFVTSAGIKEAIDNKKEMVDGDGFVKVLNGTPNIYGEDGIVLAAGASSEIKSLTMTRTKLIRLAELLNGHDDILQFIEPNIGRAQVQTYYDTEAGPRIYLELEINDGEQYIEKQVIINLDNADNLIRALENPVAPALNGNKLITNGQVYTALDGIKTEFIQENANAGVGGSTTFPTSSFASGKLYVVTILNAEEKYVHQYFDKGSAASESIYIHGNAVVPVGTDFSMLVWKDGDGGLHVDYQGEFTNQQLD